MKLTWKKLQNSLSSLVQEYKYEPQQVLDAIKKWLGTAYRKDYLDNNKNIPIHIQIDGDGNIKTLRKQRVVETEDDIEDKWEDITLKEAREYEDDVEVWEEFFIDETPETLEFSRIAAQAAAQTIKQSLKKIERERFYDKFEDKEWHLLKGKVVKTLKDNIVLEIEDTTVILTPKGQIPNKKYNKWEEILVLLNKISKWRWGVQLNITQSSSDFIEAILKENIPEIKEWMLEIKKIVRIPWTKTKVLVYCEDDRVDPVGVCVGQQWARIKTMRSLLEDERMDFVEYHEEPEILIKNALKPAKVRKVTIPKANYAKALVPSGEMGVAIGKRAANVKLAGKLTGYKINVQEADEE